jgi:hypothetical protein
MVGEAQAEMFISDNYWLTNLQKYEAEERSS